MLTNTIEWLGSWIKTLSNGKKKVQSTKVWQPYHQQSRRSCRQTQVTWRWTCDGQFSCAKPGQAWWKCVQYNGSWWILHGMWYPTCTPSEVQPRDLYQGPRCKI
jgi:hypothetical protein